MEVPVVVEVSARHVHLTKAAVEGLFGPSAKLHVLRLITEPGQFAARETVRLKGPAGELREVRVVGPERSYNQVELAITDARLLGLEPPLTTSGELAGGAPVTVIGPRGQLELPKAAIVQERHIHAAPAEAERLGLTDGQRVQCRIDGRRGATLKNVLVRVDPAFVFRLHLDTDEANALGIQTGATARVIV